MQAYKQPPDRDCQACGKRAGYKVFNTYNAIMEFFCGYCANREIERLAAIPDIQTDMQRIAQGSPDR